MQNVRNRLLLTNHSWNSLFEAAVFLAYFYGLMEWLFIVTRPSFFSAVSLWQKIRILLFTGSVLAILSVFGIVVLFLIDRLFRKKRLQTILKNLAVLFLSAILVSLDLLLFDNFTYTIFKFGIISTHQITTLIYLLGFILLILYVFRDIKKNLASFDLFIQKGNRRKILDFTIIILVLGMFFFNYERPGLFSGENAQQSGQRKAHLPNILIITADGLNAENTSVYGYERDTTPRIKELAESSLLLQNTFTNSANTSGSLLSIYTSKYPTETRTLYIPNILKGKDAYQHLPNILKSLGYYNLQYSSPIHADAYTLNVLSGFDEANGKSYQQNAVQSQVNRYLKTDYAYFFYEIGNRVFDRLRHIFFIREMINQQDLIEGKTQKYDDLAKVNRVFEIIQEKKQPVFAHIHWMGTHGPKFLPENRPFSNKKDIETQEPWDRDFYDDSIVDFDAGIGLIIDKLTELGVYENTILIVGSDHNQHWDLKNRIPLIMHFPSDEYKKTVQTNSQNIDIAPTILDYLNIEKPAWIEGSSLLAKDPGQRPIFGVGVGGDVEISNNKLIAQTVKPPFYQFGYINVIYCDTWYRLTFGNYKWEKGTVAEYQGSCSNATPVTNETVFQWMKDRLQKDGFDISSLADFPVPNN